MSDSSTANSDPSSTTSDINMSLDGPKEFLPPVEPPTASFFMQLFVTPLLIVTAIVGIWFLVTWMVRAGGKPERLVDDIEQLNHGSWQQALTLANQLRNERNAALRSDTAIARRLADVLDQQLRATGDTESRYWLTVYLCRALGEFTVDTGLDALVRAAEPKAVAPSRDPRRAALEGLTVLASHLPRGELANHATAVEVILKGTEEPSSPATDPREKREQRRLRSTATYALGVIGGDTAMRRLESLAHDTDADVRQNAVIGLARQGQDHVLPQLMALIPPSDELLRPGLDPELDENASADELAFKRNLIASAAIQGALHLIEGRPGIDRTTLSAALDRAAQDTRLSGEVRTEAQELREFLDRE